MAFKATPHPVLAMPTPEQAMELGADEWLRVMKRREQIIKLEELDPLRHGWEPPMWKICDALLGAPWIDADFAKMVREHLGFERAVDTLLIMGGNRSGKSEYAAKYTQKILNLKPKASAWLFQTNNENSLTMQQPLGWKYLPKELKKKIKEHPTYISYTFKNGFSDNKFVLPNMSMCSYRNYEQNIDSIEGGEIDVAWPDELVGSDWIRTLTLRLATREGKMILTFTPVKGYSPTVAEFQNGAITVLESIGWLLPKDKEGEMLERAFEIEQCDKWFTGEESQPEIPAGRKFERVPRVMKCMAKSGGIDDTRAIVFFHSSDNPYGNPAGVWNKIKGGTRAFIRERYYGMADKAQSAKCPKFGKAHILPAKLIPKEGTNYWFGDPAGARNMAQIWVRFTKMHCYIYREWPGNYEIPGQGIVGPWAVPDAKHPDGHKGPAQDSFGWGLKAYKRETARLEGWKDYKKAQEQPPEVDDDGTKWDPANGTDEPIDTRYLDSRAASSPRVENDRPVTLLDQFGDIGFHCDLTPGDDIAEGVTLVNDWLDYDQDAKVEGFNVPYLMVAEDCLNVIFALRTWTGVDGKNGASKDFFDLVRYLVTLGIGFNSPDSWDTEEAEGSY